MQNLKPKFLIISIIPQKLSEEEAFVDIHEVISLIETYGGKVEDILLQNREVHDKGWYIGTGKIDEATQIINDKKIDVVIFNALLKPSQIFQFQELFSEGRLDLPVWDRVDLILKIFSKHAKSSEANLQIELANMRHLGPRIYGMGTDLSQQGGGIGTRGVGETNTEYMKRHYRDQIKVVEDKLAKLTQVRQQQIEKRSELGLKTVSIVGYTNAGKTSLFNALANKKNYVKNELFATLESSVGKFYSQTLKKEVLVSDTIGFMRQLPPELIDAFKSTLMEAIYADVVIHVIDVSDKDILRKIEAVEAILAELKVTTHKKIYVFNKIDRVPDLDVNQLKEQYNDYFPQFVSAREKQGLAELVKVIEDLLT